MLDRAAQGRVSADNPPTPVSTLLGAVEQRGVLVHDRPAVIAYLAEHLDLLPVVDRIAGAAVERLGARSELSLEVVRDPESGGRHLVLLARQQRYEPDLMSVIHEVMETHWHLPAGASGWFHLSTDFQPPRLIARGLRLD
jgi:hypothetical protein